MHTDVPARARRRAETSVDSAEKRFMLGLELMLESTFEGERQMPWILTLGWLFRRAEVTRRAILPVKPTMAIGLVGDMVSAGGTVVFLLEKKTYVCEDTLRHKLQRDGLATWNCCFALK